MKCSQLFLFAALGAVCFLSACSGKGENSSTLLKRAIAAGNEAQWEKALKLSEQALELNPKNPDILLFSVLALEQNGKAAEALSRIRTLAPETGSFRIQYTLGRLLFRKGDYEKCLVPLLHANKARPNDVNTVVLLARAKTRLATGDALVYQKKLLSFPEFRNSKDVFNEIGVLLALTGKPKDAVTVFRAKCADHPVSVLNAAVVSDWHLGDRAQAAEWYNRYLRMTANRPELHRERLLVTQRLSEIR